MSGHQHKQNSGEETQQEVMQHGTTIKQNGINIQRRRENEQTNEIAKRTKPTDLNEEAETAGAEIEKTSTQKISYRKNESGYQAVEDLEKNKDAKKGTERAEDEPAKMDYNRNNNKKTTNMMKCDE